MASTCSDKYGCIRISTGHRPNAIGCKSMLKKPTAKSGLALHCRSLFITG